MSELDDKLAEYGAEIKAGRLPDTKLKETIGELSAKAEIERLYGSKVIREIVVARRGEAGAPILDILYELENRKSVLAEAKFGFSTRSYSQDWVFAGAEDGAIEVLALKEQTEQLSGVWGQERLRELRGRKPTSGNWPMPKATAPGADLNDPAVARKQVVPKAQRRMANRVDADWQRGDLDVLEIRTIVMEKDGKFVLSTHAVNETEAFNRFKQRGRSGISDASRAIAWKEAFLNKDLNAAVERHEALEKGASDANKTAVKKKTAAKTATKDAEKKKATAEKKQKAKLKAEADPSKTKAAHRKRESAGTMADKAANRASDASTRAEAAKAEAATAREFASDKQKAADRAKAERARIAKELDEQTWRRKLATKDKRFEQLDKLSHEKAALASASANTTEVHASGKQPGATYAVDAQLSDRHVGPEHNGVQSRGLETTGRAGKAIDGIAVVEKGLVVEQKLSRLVRFAELTKNIGKLTLGLFVPLTWFDLVLEFGLRLIDWAIKGLSAEKVEWLRVINFLLSKPTTIPVPIVGEYKYGLSELIKQIANASLSNESNPQNFGHWLRQWNQKSGWTGFVYVKVELTLQRQQRVISRDDEANHIRYFVLVPPTVTFTNISVFRNSKKDVTPVGQAAPNDVQNRFTGGHTNAPNRVLPKEQRSDPPATYYDDMDYFKGSQVDIQTVKVRYPLPVPALTPFDFVIFKCRNLVVELLRFVSKYDENFVVLLDKNNPADFWSNTWYANWNFPRGIVQAHASQSLERLFWLINKLEGHTTSFDNRQQPGRDRRLLLLKETLHDRKLPQLRDWLASVETMDSDRYLIKPIDPDLVDLTSDALGELAWDIFGDLMLIERYMTSSSEGRAHEYKYEGSLDPEGKGVGRL